MCIQAATRDHIGRYAEIYAVAFSGEPWNDKWRVEDAKVHVSELVESKTFYGLEYVVDGTIAGILLGTSTLFWYGRTFEVSDLAVDPAYQGKGIGARLLERCKRDIAEAGMVGIHLITASEGYLGDFYARHGFSREESVMLMGIDL